MSTYHQNRLRPLSPMVNREGMSPTTKVRQLSPCYNENERTYIYLPEMFRVSAYHRLGPLAVSFLW